VNEEPRSGLPPEQQDREEFARRLLEHTLDFVDLVVVIDAEARFRYLSPSVERGFGYAPEELLGHSVLEFVHPDDVEAVAGFITRWVAVPGPTPQLEMGIRHKNGSRRVVQAIANNLLADPAVGGIVVNARDISGRKEVEETLRQAEAEAKYRALIEAIPAITYIDLIKRTDENVIGPTSYISPQVQSVLGYSPEEWIADPGLWMSRLHPDDRERVLEADQGPFSGGRRLSLEYRLIARDDRVVWIEDESVIVADENGVPQFEQGVMLDITARKAAEQALGESLERFRVLATHAPVGIFRTDETGEMVFVNDRLCEFLGMSPDEAAGTGWVESIHPDDRDRYLEEWHRETAAGREFSSEVRLRRPDGSVSWVVAAATGLRGAQGESTGHLGTVTDITERKHAEEVLLESEAELQQGLDVLHRTDRERRGLLARILEAESEERARMAEGIEDEQIQQMAAVGIRLGTLRRGLSDPEQLGVLDKLGASVEQALGRLRNLLVELHPRALERDGLVTALRQYLNGVGARAGLDVSLDGRLDVEPQMSVRVTAYRLAQEAVANAARRAGGSRIEVAVDGRESGVFLRVADDGSRPEWTGEPTAEEPGLARMRERVELAGGWLRGRSAPGEGTVVELWLPGWAPAPAP